MAERKIFLGGGGDAEQSIALDSELAHHLETIDGLKTCLYIPAAMGKNKHAAAYDWFTENYGHLFDNIDMLGDLSDKEILKKQFSVLYIGGGNSGNLLDQIHQNDVGSYLRWQIANGGVIYGGSAGAIVLGETILTTSEEEHSSYDNDGLNMLGDRSVLAHYDDDAQQRDTVELSKRLNTHIVAIAEDAGVIMYDNSNLRAVGGLALEIRPDGTVSIIDK